MIALLVDHNIEQHGRLLWKQFDSVEWRAMHVAAMLTLSDAELADEATDREVWLFCQQRPMLLITANRNRHGADSLQAVLDELNKPDSLPILTLANPDRLLVDAEYRELCAYRIAGIAVDLHRYLGTARLFVP